MRRYCGRTADDSAPTNTIQCHQRSRIDSEELWALPRVRGRDFNDWHTQLRDWRATGEYREVLRLLSEIVAANETLPRFEWSLWVTNEYKQLGLSDPVVLLREG